LLNSGCQLFKKNKTKRIKNWFRNIKEIIKTPMKLPSFIVLLRIPFSYYLLPVFLFAMAFSEHLNLEMATNLGIILHLLVYPASNGFNSYMDKDTTSIGGLKNPPKPDIWLLVASLILNIAAIALSYYFNPNLSYLVSAYILVSILYSWHPIRLKKFPIISFLSVSIFQGFVVYSMVYLFCQNVDYLTAMDQLNFWVPALISSLMVAGAYPMTQIYQHKADAKSGDKTLSLWLGIKGTFYFSASIYALIGIWLGLFLTETNRSHFFYLYLIFVFPIIAFFIWWAAKVWADPKQANFRYTMILNKVSSTCMILYFLFIYYLQANNGLPL
jgi:4-hydroxybenzoate polyprenyltransferase